MNGRQAVVLDALFPDNGPIEIRSLGRQKVGFLSLGDFYRPVVTADFS
jgi:hypothetical protein